MAMKWNHVKCTLLFFTFKQPGDCFRSIFCDIMQASVCLEERISRNELLVCEANENDCCEDAI